MEGYCVQYYMNWELCVVMLSCDFFAEKEPILGEGITGQVEVEQKVRVR